MSWYLFNNSPERQYRGKKVDGYQNQQKTKVILDWGLGQLSPKKTQQPISKTLDKPHRTSKSDYEQQKKNDKRKIIEQAVKILTQSSDDEGKEELVRALKRYDKKPTERENNTNHYSTYSRQSPGDLPVMHLDIKHRSNKSMNVLNSFEFESGKTSNNSTKPNIDLDNAKRMRFLENSLLPEYKRDNMSAVLDFGLNEKVSPDMSDSRISGKSHFGNKKNESAVQLGDGFNPFNPMREKVKDMNQKLKEMYDYDEWCRKREKNELKLA